MKEKLLLTLQMDNQHMSDWSIADLKRNLCVKL